MKQSYDPNLAKERQFSLAECILYIAVTEESIYCLVSSSTTLLSPKALIKSISSTNCILLSYSCLRISSSNSFNFISFQAFLRMSSVRVFSKLISILPITTDTSCSSNPFYLTAKLTRVTLVLISALQVGLGSLVVRQSLK